MANNAIMDARPEEFDFDDWIALAQDMAKMIILTKQAYNDAFRLKLDKLRFLLRRVFLGGAGCTCRRMLWPRKFISCTLRRELTILRPAIS